MVSQALGGGAAFVAVVSLLPYIRDILKGRTRPHLFTWITWTAMTIIAFAAQVVGGGGPGAWATGCSAAFCVVILGLSAVHGEREITRLDWASLVVCGLAGIAWAVSRGPQVSIILVTFIDAVAFIPTLRKSVAKPHQETLTTHGLSLVKHVMSIGALSRVSLVTALYPAVLALMNTALVALMVVRRRQLGLGAQDVDPFVIAPVEPPAL